MKKWYSVHVIMYFRFKNKQKQFNFSAWENVYLIEASDYDEVREKAEMAARDEEGDDGGTLVWDGEPAETVFGGIRKIISCSNPETRPESKTELTYSEFLVEGEQNLRRLCAGDSVQVLYVE